MSVGYVLLSTAEKLSRDRWLTLSSSARTVEYQIKLVGVRSKTESGSSQKPVVLLKNIMNTGSALGFNSPISLKIAEGISGHASCGIAFVLLFPTPLYTATLASKTLKIHLWSDPVCGHSNVLYLIELNITPFVKLTN